ncbi:tape measure protein [Bosea minatitlanensis]|uniref:Tape measure protein n=1 Tax=Bosea minatitlanensis TaxID=128782 RepID=A0ABW0F1C5_9HYPH|nr:tape measure protein [Bosea minatitlanensis]MCT4492706.1 tape measure protein [Bosea minatitlanensis]
MVATVGSIEVLLKLVGAEKYALDMRGSATATEQGARRIDTAIRGTSKSTEGLANSLAGLTRGNSAINSLALSSLRATTSVGALTRSFTALGAAVGGVSGALALKTVTDYADAYTSVQNRIASVVTQQKARGAVENELFEIAQRTRSNLDATVQLYQRLTLASNNLGASQRDILRVVETTQKAFVTGGSTVQEAASTATQLSQALGSGRLQGDEFRAISENAPILFQAIANHFKVSTGELKKMSSEGLLNAKAVFEAILAATAEVDEAFARTSPTIAAGIQQIDNALQRYIGQTDKALGASQKLAGGLKYVADNISTIGDAAQYAVALVGANLFSRLLTNTATAAVAPLAKLRSDSRRAVEEAKAAQEAAQAALSRARQSLLDIDRADRLSFADRGITRQVAKAEYQVARTPLGTDAFSAAARRRDDLVALQNNSANAAQKAAAAAATAEIQKQTLALGAANTAMATAQRSATALGGALSSVGSIGKTVFGGLVAALGGGFNAALTAVSVGLIGYSIYQARAAEQAKVHKEAVEALTGALEEAKRAQSDLSNAQIIANQQTIINAKKGIDDARAEAEALIPQVTPVSGIDASSREGMQKVNDLRQSLRNLFDDILRGKKEPEDLAKALAAVGGGVDLTGVQAQFIALAQSVAGATAKVDDLTAAIRAAQRAQGDKLFNVAAMSLDNTIDAEKRITEAASGTRREADLALDAVEKTNKERAVAAMLERKLAEASRSSKESRIITERDNLLSQSRSLGAGITPEEARRQAERIIAAEDRVSASEKKPKKSAGEKAAETLAKKLSELQQDAAVAGLSDLDQKTVRFAQSAKVAAGNIDQFVKALQSGDLSKIPPDLEKIRTEIEKLESTKFARGQLDDLFPARKMEQQLKQLAIAAQSMPEVAANFDKLSEQIRVANAPDWAKDAASAISDFASSAITDFDNIGQAADNLVKALLNVALKATILKPLENALTSFLGGANPLSFLGLGGSAGVSVAAAKMHSGGLGGVDGTRISVPAAAFANAPRFHTGLGSREFAAVLEMGERVLTSRQTTRWANTMAGLSSAAATPVPVAQAPKITINNNASNQVQATAGQGSDGNLEIMIKAIEGNIADRFTRGQGPLSTAFGARQSNRQLRG